MDQSIIRFHGMGFSIWWAKEKDKAPIGNNWTKAPSKSLDELKKTYSPRNNVCVRLGDKSQLTDGTFLAVIDCDLKLKEDRYLNELNERLKKLIDVTDAPTVLSGRGNGSRHIYIKTKTPVNPFRFAQSTEIIRAYMPSKKPSKRELEILSQADLDRGIRLRPAWEISVMGTGQQTILPPSIHPDTGKRYEWQYELRTIDQIPLVEIERASKGERPNATMLDTYKPVEVDLVNSGLKEKWVNMIISGDGVTDRSASLMSVALAMLNANFKDDEIISVLTDRDYFLGNTPYDHAKTDSRTRAAQWIQNYTLKKAKYTLSAERDFEDEIEIEDAFLDDEAAREQEAELFNAEENWRSMLDRTEKLKVRGTLRNCLLVLQYAPGVKIFGRDKFKQADYIVNDTPWGTAAPKLVTDIDILQIKQWLAFHYGFEPATTVINEAVAILAKKNEWHPVIDYLETLDWDGVPRLDFWLENYLSAEGPTKYVRAVARKVLLAMVARVYRPGCKFDWVLILEGIQGSGKSTIVNILSAPWFSDAPINVSDKDGVLALQGNWVLELGEMSVMTRSDVKQLKDFISRREDKMRAPYGRRVEEYPRQCIFIGSTNDEEYLKDETGNRRFWPVAVKGIDIEGFKRDRDQLLAEAVFEFRNFDPPLYLDRETEALAGKEQAKRMEYDVWAEEVLKIVHDQENPLADAFSISDLAKHPLANAISIKNRADQMRIAKVLKLGGFKKRHTEMGKVWVRKEK